MSGCLQFVVSNKNFIANPGCEHPMRIPIDELNTAQFDIFAKVAIFVCRKDSYDVRIKHERMKGIFRVNADDDISSAKLCIIQLFQEGTIFGSTRYDFDMFRGTINVAAGVNHIGLLRPCSAIFFRWHYLEMILCASELFKSLQDILVLLRSVGIR